MKKHLFLIVSCMIMVLFAGCGNLTTPKRVEISSDATFSVPMGDIALDSFGDGEEGSLFDSLKPSKLEEKMKSDDMPGLKIYEYTADKTGADDKSLTYIVHYPLVKFPEEGEDIFGDIDLSDPSIDSGVQSVTKEITLPEVKKTESLEMFDLGASRTFFINNLRQSISTETAGFQILALPELGNTEPFNAIGYFNQTNEINVEVEHAGSIFYASGSSINVTVAKTDFTDLGSGFSLKLKGYIVDSTDTRLRGCDSGFVEVSNGGSLSIPFVGEIPSVIKIIIDAEITGGTIGNVHSYGIELGLSSSFGIDKVTGVTIDSLSDIGINVEDIDPDPVKIEGIADLFTSLTIGEGHISVKTLNPEGWEGVTCTPTISFSGLGNSNVTLPNAADMDGYLINKYLDLNRTVLAPTATDDSLLFDVDVDFTINNATFDFSNITGDPKVNVDIEYEIKKIANAEIENLNSSMNFDPDKSIDIPDMFGEMIKGISFPKVMKDESGNVIGEGKGYGFKYKVVNTLPAGNTIPFTITSAYLDYDSSDLADGVGGTKTVDPFPVTDAEGLPVDLTKYGDLTFAPPSPGDKMDIMVNFPDTLSLVNLEMNKTYKIELKDFEVVFDWNKISIDLDTPALSDSIDVPDIDFAESLGEMGLDGVGFDGIEGFIFVQKSSTGSFQNLELGGTIDLVYDGAASRRLFPDAGNTNPHAGKIGNITDITWPASADTPFTQKLENFDYVAKINLSELINSDAENAKLVYDLKFTTTGSSNLEIYSSTLNGSGNGGEQQGFNIDLAIKLPLKLSLSEPWTIDIMEMMDEEYCNDATIDLLGRNADDSPANGTNGGNGGDDGNDLTVGEVISHIDHMSLNLKLKNDLLLIKNAAGGSTSSLMSLVIEDPNALDKNGKPFKKTITITNKESVIEFTSNEIQTIVNNEVFHPSIKLLIGEAGSSILINRDIIDDDADMGDLFSMNLLFELKLDGDNPFVINLGGM